MIRVCFVCLSNICRSPLAEGVFKHLVQEAGLSDRFHIESASIGSWHVGEPADSRAQVTAHQHGIQLTSRAQQFKLRDFDRFDWVLALEEEVHAALRRLARSGAERQRIRLLRAYDPLAADDLDVPDPYYGGQEEFEQAYAMIERSCRELLKELSK